MSLETIRLRPAVEQDEGFLCHVYAESRRAELDQVAWAEGERERFLRMQFDAQSAHYLKHYPGAEYWIIELVGSPAGRLYLRRSSSEIRIMDIALIPGARGHGVGTLLLGRILDEGRAAQKMVTIHVEKFNPALRLYERLGFRAVEDRGAYWFLQWEPETPAGRSGAGKSAPRGVPLNAPSVPPIG